MANVVCYNTPLYFQYSASCSQCNNDDDGCENIRENAKKYRLMIPCNLTKENVTNLLPQLLFKNMEEYQEKKYSIQKMRTIFLNLYSKTEPDIINKFKLEYKQMLEFMENTKNDRYSIEVYNIKIKNNEKTISMESDTYVLENEKLTKNNIFINGSSKFDLNLNDKKKFKYNGSNFLSIGGNDYKLKRDQENKLYLELDNKKCTLNYDNEKKLEITNGVKTYKFKNKFSFVLLSKIQSMIANREKIEEKQKELEANQKELEAKQGILKQKQIEKQMQLKIINVASFEQNEYNELYKYYEKNSYKIDTTPIQIETNNVSGINVP